MIAQIEKEASGSTDSHQQADATDVARTSSKHDGEFLVVQAFPGGLHLRGKLLDDSGTRRGDKRVPEQGRRKCLKERLKALFC